MTRKPQQLGAAMKLTLDYLEAEGVWCQPWEVLEYLKAAGRDPKPASFYRHLYRLVNQGKIIRQLVTVPAPDGRQGDITRIEVGHPACVRVA